jgi:uncharacterized membrane protein YccC
VQAHRSSHKKTMLRLGGKLDWRAVLVHSARTSVVAVAALLLARLLRLPESYWAPITSLVITQSSLGAAFSISWQRFVGTIFGAAVGGIVAGRFGPHLLTYAACIFLLGIVCAITRTQYSAYRFGAVALTIVALIPRSEPPWMIAFHRFAEVSIGIGVALFFTLVWPEKDAPAPK